jgi:hypothetical protein
MKLCFFWICETRHQAKLQWAAEVLRAIYFLCESSRNTEQENALKINFLILHYFKYLKHKNLIF